MGDNIIWVNPSKILIFILFESDILSCEAAMKP